MTNRTDKVGQCKSLTNFWGIPYRLSPRGWPLVLISDAEKTLGLSRSVVGACNSNSSLRLDQPDFSKIKQ